MTAEMPADKSEETLVEEDNSEETGEEVDDVIGDEEPLPEQFEDTQEEDDGFWNGNPEALPEELKSVYKNMQGAFTKRMQRLSSLEKKYFDSIDAANAAVFARTQEQQAPQVEEVPEETAPDLAQGAKPEDVISFYVQKEVRKAMESSGVDSLAKEMQPVAHRERVVGAYRQFAEQHPKLDHQKLAPLAGQVIDADPELAELAQTNPGAAIRLATRVAQAELKTMSVKQKSKKRRQAAPVAARSGTVVKRRRESMLDAATRALKEAGLNPDHF
jgi:hypothetical protein